jgi:hypothetical protein
VKPTPKFTDMLTARADVVVTEEDARASSSLMNSRARAVPTMSTPARASGTLEDATDARSIVTPAPDASGAVSTNETTRASAKTGRTCDRCRATTTSRWRKLHGGYVCKACHLRHERARNASSRAADGRTCVECGAETSRGDWVRAKGDGDVSRGWRCGACYDGWKRKRRQAVGVERTCPRCEETTVMWLLRDPEGKVGADGEAERVCVKCYQKAKYRARKSRDARRCEVCGAGRATMDGTRAWRRLPRVSGEEASGTTKWACEPCFQRRETTRRADASRRDAAANAAMVRARAGGGGTSTVTPRASKFCAFCETEKESSKWRKIDGKDACSTCYQAAWRRRKEESGP